LNPSWGFNSLDGVGQLPSDVVEAGPEVVDNLTGSDAESKGNRDFLGSFLQAVPGITLPFSDDGLTIFDFDISKWERINKLGYKTVQVADILVGNL